MPKIIKEQPSEILAEIMEEVRPVYSGHPALPKGSAIEEPKEEDEPSPAPADTEDGEIEPAIEEEPAEELVEEPAEKPVSFKYRSQEEAEKAYKEAERLITERAEEAKRERERAEDLQHQLNEFLADTKEKPKEKEVPFRPSSSERMQNLLSSINKLDPENDDYDKQVANLWGQLEDERMELSKSETRTAIKEYDRQVREEQQSFYKKQKEQEEIIASAVNMATGDGLNMKDNSPDSELFWAFANMAPEGTLEDQTKWTINKVKEHKKPIVVDKDKAKKVQQQNEVLERRSEKPPPSKPGPIKPMTLGEAFEQTERRI